MISEARDVLRYTCDGIGCSVERLHAPAPYHREADAPVGWYRIGTGFRFVVFHHIDCAYKWISFLAVEQRDTHGWMVGPDWKAER